MSNQTPPPPPPGGAAPYSLPPQEFGPPTPPAKKPWWKRKRIVIPAGVATLFLIGSINGAADGPDDETPPSAQAATSEPTVVEEKTAEEVAAEEEAERKAEEERAAQEEAERIAEEERKAEEARLAEEERVAAEAAAAAEAARIGSVSQQNAYRSAQSYLDFTAFSRAGLINQLTSEYGEGYPLADAEFAVARLEAEGGVDWNAEAAESAKNYLEFTSFSRAGLIDQLTSQYGEGFTLEQAEYGVSQTGL